MPTRYAMSPWIHQSQASRAPSFPRLRGPRTADVVVIGGGLTGCAAAYTCAAAGLDTVLLESGRMGHGRSGRGAGLMTPDPGLAFRDVTSAHGLKSARRIFEAWRRGAVDGAALLKRLRITCALESADALIIARDEQEKILRRESDARREAGLDVASLTHKQVQARMRLDAAAGLRLRDGFMLDPHRAALGLAAAAARAGASCHEHSLVKKVRFTRKHANVMAEGGTIRARKVIVATNSATVQFRSLQRHFTRREMYMVMTEPIPAPIRRQVGDPRVALRDMSASPHYVRSASDDRLLVAGADQDETPERLRATVLVQRTGQLMYELLKMYPAISGLRPAYGWEAAYGRTADGLPYIGAHRNYPHHVFALGGSPVSVTGAFVAARVLLRAVQDTPDAADEVFSWTR